MRKGLSCSTRKGLWCIGGVLLLGWFAVGGFAAAADHENRCRVVVQIECVEDCILHDLACLNGCDDREELADERSGPGRCIRHCHLQFDDCHLACRALLKTPNQQPKKAEKAG